MKSKYKIGDKVVFLHPIRTSEMHPEERIGLVTGVEYKLTDKGLSVDYLVNDFERLRDSDILGKIKIISNNSKIVGKEPIT